MTSLVCSSLKFIVQKVPCRVWAALPIVLQATVLRKRGSFTYRRIVGMFCVFITLVYGLISTPILSLLGKDAYICRNVSQFHSGTVRLFLALDVILEGEENFLDADQPAIYVINHQTILDLHYMAFCFPKQASIVAKKSLKSYPFMGWFLTLIKSVFVDRANSGDAIKQARQVAEDMKRLKTSIFVYPEGTRRGVETIGLSEFKKGPFHMATQAKVPIVPLVVANYKNIYDPKRKFYTHGTIKIRVLPPISTEGIKESSEAVSQLAIDVREKMLTTIKEISVVVQNEGNEKNS